MDCDLPCSPELVYLAKDLSQHMCKLQRLRCHRRRNRRQHDPHWLRQRCPHPSDISDRLLIEIAIFFDSSASSLRDGWMDESIARIHPWIAYLANLTGLLIDHILAWEHIGSAKTHASPQRPCCRDACKGREELQVGPCGQRAPEPRNICQGPQIHALGDEILSSILSHQNDHMTLP